MTATTIAECQTCRRRIAWQPDQNAWTDADSPAAAMLVFCFDPDDVGAEIRHEPAPAIAEMARAADEYMTAEEEPEPLRCFLCREALEPDNEFGDVCGACYPEDEARNRRLEADENRHEL
jgi:hypothetical protein